MTSSGSDGRCYVFALSKQGRFSPGQEPRFGNEQDSKSREFWKRVGFGNAQDFSAHAI